MKTNCLLLLGTVLVLSSCYPDTENFDEDNTPFPNSNTNTGQKTYSNVDHRMWSYFQSFEKEAALRNINIDLEALEITGDIKEIEDDGVAGSCQFGQHIHHVTIDQSFWDNTSTTGREFVIYHELGHCGLARGHYEGMNSEGLCLSIMASGLGECRSAYNGINRDAYLDELFLNTE